MASIDAVELANIFVEASLPANGGSAKAEQLRSALLPLTIRHAYENSAYYRKVLSARIFETPPAPGDLGAIPLLSKEILKENRSSIVTCGERGTVQFTSGTTGSPLPVYRAEQEISFLKEFHSAVQRILHSGTNRPAPLILNIANMYHGNVLDIPSRGYRISTGLFDSVLLRQIKHWLTSPHQIPEVESHISTVSGLYQSLQMLTAMLADSDFDFSQSKVERIYSAGGHLTPRWEQLMRYLWGAAVIPVYSLSEVFTFSNRCLECGSYHFLPNVIPELICPATHAPRVRGVGMLVLTGLYPFVQGQPVLRYMTGDFFCIEHGQCAHGAGYRFIGRQRDSVILNFGAGRQVVVGGALMDDILDEEPDINRWPFFEGLPGFSDNGTAGKMKYLLKIEQGSDGVEYLKVVVELRYNPLFYRRRVEILENRILEQMLKMIENLALMAREGKCRVGLVFKAPGTIQ